MTWPWWGGALCALPYYGASAWAGIAWMSTPSVRDFEPLPPDESPLVTIIVPARNESLNIDRCLRSILASEYRNIQVICVDDRSTDDTAKIAEKIAAADARLTVLHGVDLPKGWYGKPWACWQGFELAKGNILLFTDADSAHGPKLLAHTVAALEAQRADMVTVFPLQEMKSFWERAVNPFFFLLMGMRFGSPRRLNKNRNPRHGIANGQFIMVTRDSYEWVGGHKKVHATVVEDLMLGVEYLRGGRKIYFAGAEEDMRVRMYSSLAGIVEGWSKNFFRGALQMFDGNKVLTFFAVLGTLWIPAAFLLPAVMLGVGLATGNVARIGFGAAGFVGCSLLIGMMMRMGRASMLYGITHPIGALVLARILIRAAARGTSRIEWKGRTYTHS